MASKFQRTNKNMNIMVKRSSVDKKITKITKKIEAKFFPLFSESDDLQRKSSNSKLINYVQYDIKVKKKKLKSKNNNV